MKASDIKPGMILILKPARRQAYDWPNDGIVVDHLKYKPGYKTPWVIAPGGYAFTPSDFSRSA